MQQPRKPHERATAILKENWISACDWKYCQRMRNSYDIVQNLTSFCGE